MKEKISWIMGIVELVVGIVIFVAAQNVISNNSSYTWRRPYTVYEEKIVLWRLIGLALIAFGVLCIGVNIYKIIFTNKHVKEIDQLTKHGGAVKCPDCGLVISADVKNKLHHFLEAVPVDVPSREAVVHEGKYFVVPLIRLDDGTAVFQLGLAADAVFPLYGFPGVENDCH